MTYDFIDKSLATVKPHFVPKGWGNETWFINDDYCTKKLFLIGGKKLSWHYHKIKDEVFYVAHGRIIVYYSWDDDLAKADKVFLYVGDTFHVPTGLRHRIEALENSDVIESSTHHKDSDSIRIITGD